MLYPTNFTCNVVEALRTASQAVARAIETIRDSTGPDRSYDTIDRSEAVRDSYRSFLGAVSRKPLSYVHECSTLGQDYLSSPEEYLKSNLDDLEHIQDVSFEPVACVTDEDLSLLNLVIREAFDVEIAAFANPRHTDQLACKMAADGAFHRFSHGHQDLVLAVDYNFYGTRMVTASSDHRLKVWDRRDDGWSVTDVWVAHDAEVTDVKWNGPFVGEILASVGEDGLLRIWQEDISEAPNSGRRFKRIYEQQSATRVPYMSLDFKNIDTETYLAAISRDGYLTVCEPVDHDSLTEWTIMWHDYLGKTPSRTEETGFRVCWHHEKLPAWPAILAGLDRKSLSLAVSVMDTVKIFRTDKDRLFYTAAELKGAKGLVRDIAWANGSMRGYDVIATASKDGHVRIYELHTPGSADMPTSTDASKSVVPSGTRSSNISSARQQRSGIGAGLAGGTRSGRNEEEGRPGMAMQEVKLVAELSAHEGAIWRVSFSHMGDLLVSTGDDGLAQVWKRGINNQWLQYAEIDATKDN